MHLENLAPLLRVLPLAVLFALALGGWLAFERGRHRRHVRNAQEDARRYWLAEMAYRAKVRAREWLSRTRTPRLTYQGPPLGDQPAAKRRRGK